METPLPKFDTFEELEAYLKKQRSNPANANKKAPTGAKKSTTSRRRPAKSKVQPDTAQKLTKVAEIEDAEKIYQSVHYYTRDHDSWNAVLQDARQELKFRNTNVLVFAHNHKFNEVCTGSCRRVTP